MILCFRESTHDGVAASDPNGKEVTRMTIDTVMTVLLIAYYVSQIGLFVIALLSFRNNRKNRK